MRPVRKLMFKRHHYIIFCITATLSLAVSLKAQPKAIGCSYSFNGFGIVYEHNLQQDNFLEVKLKTDMQEVFLGRTSFPGASASICWNYVLHKMEDKEGNLWQFFAGPGVGAGYGKDFRKDEGWFIGLQGSGGAECLFRRNISISFTVNPLLSIQFSRDRERGTVLTTWYRNGIIWALMPELSIKYSF